MLQTYSRSGRVSPRVLPVALIMTVVFAALAWVYQLIVGWLPLIYLSALVTVGFGIVGAGLAVVIVHAGRCRNLGIAFMLVVPMLLAGVATSHDAAYQQFRAEIKKAPKDAVSELGPGGERMFEEIVQRVLAQLTFENYVEARVENGWSVKGRATSSSLSFTGAFVWIIWGIELLIVLALGAGGALYASDLPYCEPCGRWVDSKRGLLARMDLDDAAIQRLAEAATLEDLLPPGQEGGVPSAIALEYKLNSCPDCEESNFLTLTRTTVKVNRKGQPEKKTKSVLENIVLSKPELERLEQLAAKLLASATPPQPPPPDLTSSTPPAAPTDP